MPTVSSLKQSDALRKYAIDRTSYVELKVVGAADTADNGDNIEVFDLPAGFVFVPVSFGHDATLGTSCTAQLRVGTTAVTAATTAAGASYVGPNGTQVSPSTSEQSVNILIGGADITAAANFYVRGFVAAAQTVALG